MAVTIDGLQMLGAQESQTTTETQADVTSAPSQDSDENLVVALEAQETIPLSGIATGIRLSSRSGYPSDPADALAQWVQRFETLCQAEQGEGWTVADDERGTSVNAVVTEASWTHNAGGPYEVQWDLTAEVGEGVLDDAPRGPTTATPNAVATLTGPDGTVIDLGSVDEKRTELSVGVDVTPIAYAGPGESVITPTSGSVRQVTLSGRVGGPLADLRAFESDVQSLAGSNQQVTYQTGFPGTTHDVVVQNFDATHVGGQPATLRYSLSVVEGLAL